MLPDVHSDVPRVRLYPLSANSTLLVEQLGDVVAVLVGDLPYAGFLVSLSNVISEHRLVLGDFLAKGTSVLAPPASQKHSMNVFHCQTP